MEQVSIDPDRRRTTGEDQTRVCARGVLSSREPHAFHAVSRPQQCAADLVVVPMSIRTSNLLSVRNRDLDLHRARV